jgi:transcriptional regulator with XRE-family HTH domain
MSPSSASPGEFPTRLRAAREAKDLSQADLSQRTGLQPSAISHFETGRRSPSFDNLRVLADALSVTTDYLIGRDRIETPAGPNAERMFRDYSQLTSADQDKLAEFVKFLAAKDNKEKGGDEGAS